MARKSRQRKQQISRTQQSRTQQFFYEETVSNRYIQEQPPQIKKSFHLKDLKKISPMTPAQEEVFFSWYDADRGGYVNDVVMALGVAGSGKSLIACYLGLQAILDPDTPYEKLIIVRSVVPSRDTGFLPGDLHEKCAPYMEPYKQIFNQLFPWQKTFQNMQEIGLVDFEITSFMRGQTLENCIVFFDELQNTTEVELETVLTRLGKNARMILAGDIHQNDLGNKSGLSNVLRILRSTEGTSLTEFGIDDIVRSGWVKAYLKAKYKVQK